MAKARTSFICQNCGAVALRWQGKCEACNEWNSLVEEAPLGRHRRAGRARRQKGPGLRPRGPDRRTRSRPRACCRGLAELDRVTGGGFVPGSVLLIGGEPGIGKSTLLIQACAALARRGERVVYISGEEATAQVRLRAERLGLADAPVELAAETSVEDIIATLSRRPAPGSGGDRFDPDHVDRNRRGDARDRDARCAAPRRR